MSFAPGIGLPAGATPFATSVSFAGAVGLADGTGFADASGLPCGFTADFATATTCGFLATGLGAGFFAACDFATGFFATCFFAAGLDFFAADLGAGLRGDGFFDFAACLDFADDLRTGFLAMGILRAASPTRGGSGVAGRSPRQLGAALENLKSYHAVVRADST